MKQFESVGAWIAASDSDTEALLKRVVADIAADQLKEARLRRRQRLEEINHPPDCGVWNLTDRH
jgi:hypothetical protein|tara:strand:- start:281 stop:472 length:192 start_codon:yes stop_codon:yes gene_type:complete